MPGPKAGTTCSRCSNPRRKGGRHCLACHAAVQKKHRCKEPTLSKLEKLKAKVAQLMHRENEQSRFDSKRTANLWEWISLQVKTRYDIDVCWDWPYGKNPAGYGLVTMPQDRRVVPAHRAAFFMLVGHWPRPNGLHRCDRPCCYNPHHIFEGTAKDNFEDMMAKGRKVFVKGSAHGASKLTEEDVITIRRLCPIGTKEQIEIAKRFGVSQSLISRIIGGKIWKHVENS